MKPCVVANCQKPGKKAVCCGAILCPEHGDSVLKHECANAKRLDEIASDPKKLRDWKRAQEGEEGQTQEIVDALEALQDIEIAWQSRKRGGVRANDAARAVGDITAISRPDGLHIEVELKGSHKDDCACDSCVPQRERADRIRAAGGVYVGPVRNKQQAVDGVRLGLARARGRSAA